MRLGSSLGFLDNSLSKNDFDNRNDKSKVKSHAELISTSYEIKDEEDNENENQENRDEIEDRESQVENIIEERELPRRSERTRKPSKRDGAITGDWWEIATASNSCADDVMGEPRTLEEALNSTERSEWKKVLDREILSLIKHKTWTLVELPKDQNIVDSKWVFKVKYNTGGSVE